MKQRNCRFVGCEEYPKGVSKVCESCTGFTSGNGKKTLGDMALGGRLDQVDPPYESINHPQHYNIHPFCECIDIIEHFPHNIGAIIKYLWRAGLKPDVSAVEDLQKAKWYLEREIERLSKEA